MLNMNIKPITNELRGKVLEKIQSVLQSIQMNTSAEVIENSCFEKSENNAEVYVKMCQTFIANRRGSTMQNYRPNTAGTSNNGTPSDPINALQNLTVTAGQPNQINMQQTNVAQQMNPRLNSNMFTGQIRPRAMMPTTVQSGNMQRPMEQQFPMSQSPTTQIIQPQMQQVHNMINTNNIRLITKNVQNSPMPIYQLDNTNTAVIQNQQIPNQQMLNQSMANQQIVNQQMTNQQIVNQPMTNQQMLGQPMTNQQMLNQSITNQQMVNQPMTNQQMVGQQMQGPIMTNIVRPQLSRMMNSSPAMPNNTSQSIPMSNQVFQDQYAVVKPNPATPGNNMPQGEMNTSSSINNQTCVTIASGVSNGPVVATNQNPSNAPVKVPVSDEELVKVREELLVLSERYLKYIKLVLENPDFIIGEQNMKVWVTLKGVLDDPRVMNKNISLKHVARIQDFCEKAEKIVQQNDLDKSKPINAKSEELFGKRVIPDRNRVNAAMTDMTSSVNADFTGSTNNVNNSLDAAFDDVIHQLKKKDPKMLRNIQKNLVTFVRNNSKNFLHYLPKKLQIQEEDVSSTECTKMDTNYDEHEFDYLDGMLVDGIGGDQGRHQWPMKGRARVLDQFGLLRTDIDTGMLASEFASMDSEIDLVRGEFQVQEMPEQTPSPGWCTTDDVWGKASFLAVKYVRDSLPSPVPVILLRVPHDYDHCGSVDWNLDLDSYLAGPAAGGAASFLGHVRHALDREFGHLAVRYHWSGVNLLQALSVYKRSIITGISNYESRKALSSS